ncbi:MAG: hypothetical protein IJZ83_09210 [Clostridia bacterium]|nr:hypothetical protein [Clostridia bacterium]
MKSTGYHSAQYERKMEKYKIIFQFALMSLASVIAGICLAHLLNESALEKTLQKIILHFKDSRGSSFSESALKYAYICLPDIFSIALIFIFSFSFINYVISDFVLVFVGIKFGINASLIKLMGFEEIGIINSLSYWLIRFVLLIALTAYSCGMAFYSMEIKKFTQAGRIILNKKTTLLSILLTLTFIGLIFMLNGIYFLIIDS